MTIEMAMTDLFIKSVLAGVLIFILISFIISVIDESHIKKDCEGYDSYFVANRGPFWSIDNYKVICIDINRNNEITTKVIVRG